jgi:hypothetical protein
MRKLPAGDPESHRPLGRARHGWEYKILMNFKAIRWGRY